MINRLCQVSVMLTLFTACTPQIVQKDGAAASHTGAQMQQSDDAEQLRQHAEQALADYNYHAAADWANSLKQQTGSLSPHLQRVLDDYGPLPEIVCTSCTFGLADKDLADLTEKAERGDAKAANRLAEYYAFELNDMKQYEYWHKKASGQ